MARVVMFEELNTGELAGYEFHDLVEIIETRCPGEVVTALEKVEKSVNRGMFGAGFISYEAAEGLDSAFRVHSGSELPLVWFGVFRRKEPIELIRGGDFAVGDWQPSISEVEYREGISKIKDYIAKGDTYQVNYTYRLRAGFEGDPWGFFVKMFQTQPSPFGAFIDLGEIAICSASPEVFFRLEGENLLSRPMKGTAPRGLSYEEDQKRKRELERSAKDRAENAMIVDMIRNDMGKVARVGSVRVSSLFHVERYPTVFQMTSTVSSATVASFAEIITALFPCASITGAPKVRTMEIIQELEPESRGVYTGCIGFLAPGRRAGFNVAIRTAVIDRGKKEACYGVGGGIVWDSTVREEYEESRTKALVLTADRPEFKLLETLLWDGKNGFFLLDRHLKRLAESAEYFGFFLDLKTVQNRLEEAGKKNGESRHKVRLCADRRGDIWVESLPFPEETPSVPWRVGLADRPVDSKNPFLYHKTTNRKVYEEARTKDGQVDDILLWNEHGYVTETRIGNVVIEKEGKLITPPVTCGLLPGVFRGELMERGQISEGFFTIQDILETSKFFVINSVRKWMPAKLGGYSTIGRVL